MNDWNKFQKENKGCGLTMKERSFMYHLQQQGGTKDSAKQQLSNYVKGLYEILGQTKACFLSGAFVIEDPENRLSKILTRAKGTTLKNRFLKSHTSFNPHTKGACEGVCEVHIPDFIGKCGDESRTYRNIKWYTFNNKEDQAKNPERFVYFKLETMKTFTSGHVRNASERYLLGKQPHESKLPKRREDCLKDKRGCACSKSTGCPDDPKGFLIDNRCAINKPTHDPIGDEFFISKDVNHALIDNQPVGLCSNESH